MTNILVIVSEENIRDLCCRILIKENYSVKTAVNSKEAILLIKKEYFDLIIIELQKKFQFIKQIKKLYIPVIVILKQTNLRLILNAINFGMVDYVVKSHISEELIPIVKKALEEKELIEQKKLFESTVNFYNFLQEYKKEKTEKEILNFCIQNITKCLNANSGSISIYDTETDKLNLVTSIGLKKEITTSFTKGEKIIGYVAKEKKSILINNGLKKYKQFNQLHTRKEICSSLIVPLLNDENLLGIICVNRISKKICTPFSKKELSMLSALSKNITLAITSYISKEELTKIEKIKYEILSNVSHELRTPLMAISGALDLLEESNTYKKQNVLFELTRRNITRINNLVKNLLDLSQLENGNLSFNFRKCKIDELLDNSIKEFSIIAKEKNILFEYKKQTDLPEIKIDLEKFNQVLHNLFSNAVKFTQTGGKITVCVNIENNKNIIISVKDTGIGIPPKYHEKIFEKLFQVNSTSTKEHSGIGLGLSIVKEIVTAHNGNIWVKSKLNKGATFFVSLPI